MDLRQLKIFVSIAEEGSIHAGARRLLTAQPAVSTALRKLEREVGGALVVRSSKGIELTPAGAALLADARSILDRVETMENSVRELANCERQTLRVGLVVGIVSAGDLTIPILQEFRRRHPHIDLEIIELSLAEQFNAVTDGTVEVAIVRPPSTDERIEQIPLFAEPRFLCCSSDHPLAYGTEVEIDDVLEQPMIELVNTPEPWRSFWMLNELRNRPQEVKSESAAVTLSQIQVSLALEPVTMPTAFSAWKLAMQSPSLRTVDVPALSPSQVAVAYRSDQNQVNVSSFSQCARDVSHALIKLIPGAELLPA